MEICTAVGYSAGTILTIGISQVIGTVGLLCIAIKAIYDRVQLDRYQDKLAETAPEDLLYAKYANKVQYYTRRNADNELYATAFAFSLISLSLNYYMGCMGPTFATCLSDCVSLFSPEVILRIAPFPLNGISRTDYEKDHPKIVSKRTELKEKWNAEELHLHTEEQEASLRRTLDALWVPAKGKDEAEQKEACTVILFHGNSMVLEDLDNEAKWYSERGCNVLMMTFGGYPGSTHEQPTTELSLSYDAQACVNYVKTRLGHADHSKILAHGYSIGGAAAFQAASYNPGIHVVTDKAFTSLFDAGTSDLPYPWMKTFVANTLEVILPKNESDGVFKTDGMNNVEKAKKVTGSYLGLYVDRDEMMFNPDSDEQENLTKALIREVAGAQSHCYPGTHNTGRFYNNRKAYTAVENFLSSINFIPAAAP